MKRPVEFYSEGVKLRGDIYLPDDLQAGERRAGIVLCHGYTGVKDLHLPDTARVLNIVSGFMARATAARRCVGSAPSIRAPNVWSAL
jgi:hypothetical protein